MDNITHSLIGLVAAEPLAITRKPRARAQLWIASAIANNLPDFDVFYTWPSRSDPLHYLLHHRGHTHTLLLAPIQGLLLFLALRWFWRKREIPWKEVAALCLLGPFLHIFADSWNSYGVHPFWPWNNHWFYGDIVFILEPWLWAIFLPPLWKRAESKVGKGICLAILALLIGLCWFQPMARGPVAIAVTIFSAAWMLAQHFLKSDRARLALTFAAVGSYFGIFAEAQLAVRAQIPKSGDEVALLTTPGNPFCWTTLNAGFQGESYHASAWQMAAWPKLVKAESCPAMVSSREFLVPLAEAPTEARIPLGEFRGTRAEYQKILQSCRAKAYLRFARIPVWKLEDKKIFLTDLRFLRGSRSGFAELFEPGDSENCPRFEPPWIGRFFPQS